MIAETIKNKEIIAWFGYIFKLVFVSSDSFSLIASHIKAYGLQNIGNVQRSVCTSTEDVAIGEN